MEWEALPFRIQRPIYMEGHLITLSARQLAFHRYVSELNAQYWKGLGHSHPPIHAPVRVLLDLLRN
jgi:hypothetical protein